MQGLTREMIEELIELGVLEKKRIDLSNIFDKPIDYLEISEKYKDLVFNYVESIVLNCIKPTVELRIDGITSRLDFLSYDNRSRNEYLEKSLSDLINQLDDITLKVYRDKDTLKSKILKRCLTHKDIYEFVKNEQKITLKIKDLLERDCIKEWIDIATTFKVIDFIKENLKSNIRSISNSGFQSSLEPPQIENLFNSLINGDYIDKNTNPDHFKAVFKNEPLPEGFKPIKWILLNNKKQPHKTALREFLTLALGKSPDRVTINTCFIDSKGRNIQLAKPKVKEFLNYYSNFEKMLKL